MNKYNNPRLLNAVVSGTGMKHPIQPHVVVGDESNGFIRGDLMDANAIVDLVNSILHPNEGENTTHDPYNGHEYVDLGLPSGTKWAKMNVGATNVTDYGNYYMYGKGSKTYDGADTQYEGSEDPLALSADTAAQVWGGDWHMPTADQIDELLNNTDHRWIANYNDSGINGALFTAQNGNSIFFPAAGGWANGRLIEINENANCWSSTPSITESSTDLAYALICAIDESNNSYIKSNLPLVIGIPVRGVVGQMNEIEDNITPGVVK